MELIKRRPRMPGSSDCGFDVPEDICDDLTQGYRDGMLPDSPWPGSNRSDAYRHGFVNAAQSCGRAEMILFGLGFILNRMHLIASRARVGPEWWPEFPIMDDSGQGVN